MKIKDFFSSSNYLIRLDDASHFSDLSKWNRISSILNKHNIKPIVAVIPNNKDKSLFYSNFNPSFWDLVKSWENNNWSIAMHGFNHLFHKVRRNKLILPFYDRSEFAELSLDSQKRKIKSSLKLFKQHGINPKIWIAPAHCFDSNTLKAIKEETAINVVSDGIAFHSYLFRDFYFIPQQLWDFKKRLFGIWTICLHPDTMSLNEIEEFERKIEYFVKQNKIINIEEVSLYRRKRSIIEKLYSHIFWIKYDLKYFLNQK